MKKEIYVVLDNIRSAFNVGAIFRTADCAAVSKIFLCGICAYPPNPKLLKTAIGATEFVKWEYFKTTKKAIETLKKNKCQIVAVEITKKSKNIYKTRFNYPVAFIFGHEIKGISEEILSMCDKIVQVPIFGKKESLNVETCAGIVLFELIRRNFNKQK